jgi:hypothetical protein
MFYQGLHVNYRLNAFCQKEPPCGCSPFKITMCTETLRFRYTASFMVQMVPYSSSLTSSSNLIILTTSPAPGVRSERCSNQRERESHTGLGRQRSKKGGGERGETETAERQTGAEQRHRRALPPKVLVIGRLGGGVVELPLPRRPGDTRHRARAAPRAPPPESDNASSSGLLSLATAVCQRKRRRQKRGVFSAYEVMGVDRNGKGVH